MQLAESWLKSLRQAASDVPLTVSEVRIGVFYTAVQLDTGHVGVAFTPRDLHDTVCCPRSAAAAPLSGRLIGQSVWDLAQYVGAPLPLRRAVGVAALNAVSARALELHGVPGGQMQVGVDAVDAAAVRSEDRVALVGAFIPFIKALKGRVADLWVVDKHREALQPDELAFWRSPEQAAAVLAEADVALITGSALVEGGIDALLQATCRARTVVLAGPTASCWPPPFFACGVDVLGGIRVRNGRKMLQLVSEGGSGYFFQEIAEKVCMIKASRDSVTM